MTEYHGITGTYADLKLVKTRGVVQVILEFPIEDGQRVLEALGGLPMPGKEEHVALGLVSRLTPAASAEANAQPEERRAQLSVVGKERYANQSEMERARTRAALYAQDPEFWRWARLDNKAQAEQYIRNWIGGSRALIADDDAVYRRFLAMETAFLRAVGRMAEDRA